MSEKIPFEPKNFISYVQGKEYLEVKWRLVWFRDQYPEGRIDTAVIYADEQRALVRAEVTAIGGGEVFGSASGMAQEWRGAFESYIEKAETAAIGRALAALGFGTQFADDYADSERPSDSPVGRGGHSDQGGKQPYPINQQRGGGGYNNGSQSATNQRSGGNRDGRATSGQIKTIHDMARERALEANDLATIIRESAGAEATLDNLTVNQASALFEKLKAIPRV